ncbi:MAG: hypothetical protein IJY58_04110 [Alphaproteobacteria bacterium]|nr:hypothetical protein [Alphaproteobacteria bacterium]
MAYISKQLDEFQLPDGTVVSSVREIDSYLNRTGLAMSSDYSPQTLQQIRTTQEQRLRQELLATFLQQYKRKIWNEK